MNILALSILLSPVIAAIIATVVYLILRICKKPTGDSIILVFYFLAGGITLGGISFIVIMVFSTLADANQDPLSFFFIFGPLGFTLGSLLGLVKFIKTKPTV